jgi:hypothetical protein
MGFAMLIYFILSMRKESTQNALERFNAGKKGGSCMTQQAFSEARQKIKWQAFREMFDFGVNAHYVNYAGEIQLWNGFRISAVDGSILALPNDPALGAYYGTSGAGDKSPAARGSLLYDILNRMVLDARIEKMTKGERAIAQKHINHLCRLDSFQEWKELLLFDRGYPSYEFIKELLERKIHFLMRVREKFSTAIDGLGYGDHNIELERNGEKIPVRVIKFRLKSGETETLITDVMDSGIKMEELKALYFKRWPIETKYNEIKNKLEIENFSGRLVNNIRQDFYATMLLTNLASDFFIEAQEEVDKIQEGKGNKWKYQINVNHEIGVLKDWLIRTMLEEDGKKRGEGFMEIVRLLEKRLTPIRPNRSIPRNNPRKAKFHHNHKSNC